MRTMRGRMVTTWLVRLGVLTFLVTTLFVAGAQAVVSQSDFEVPAPISETLGADDVDAARPARLVPSAAVPPSPVTAMHGALTKLHLARAIFQPPEAA